jgi:hypothetical protein
MKDRLFVASSYVEAKVVFREAERPKAMEQAMDGHLRGFIDPGNLTSDLQTSFGRSGSGGETADSYDREPLQQKVEDTDQLPGPARPQALRETTQQIQAINLTDRSIAHDLNNLLQAAISSVDLMQIRLKQGRISEILPLIEKAQTALCLAGSMASRRPNGSAATVLRQQSRSARRCATR